MARQKTPRRRTTVTNAGVAAATGGPRLYTLEVFLIGGPVSGTFVARNPVVSRTILIRGDQTLQDLHHALFAAFDREEEHLYEFQVGGEGPMDPAARRYVLPGAFDHPDGEPAPAGRVDRTTLDSLDLKVDDRFGYWFDFGDDWWHQVNVEAVADEVPKGDYPRVTKRVGRSPPQYADLDDDAEEDDEGEDDAEGEEADELSEGVPKKLRKRYEEVVAATDRFCDRHLDAEYKALCRELTALLCREGFPLDSGKAAGWAAGVVYSIAWVNFLGDPSQEHHLKAEDIARGVGVSPATLMNRARVIREGLELRRMDPRWSTRGMLERNPLVWMAEVGGVPVDLRQAPRAVQEEANRQGLIPFVPGEGGEAG